MGCSSSARTGRAAGNCSATPLHTGAGRRTAATWRSSRGISDAVVHVVELSSGAVRAVDEEMGRYDVDWSPRGHLLAVGSETALSVIDAASGASRVVVPEATYEVEWAPDGRSLAYTARLGDELFGWYENGDVRVTDLAGHSRTVVEARGAYGGGGGLTWTRPPAGVRYRAPQPRTIATLRDDGLTAMWPTERIDHIAADGDRVAYSTCGHVFVWTPETHQVVQADPSTSLVVSLHLLRLLRVHRLRARARGRQARLWRAESECERGGVGGRHAITLTERPGSDGGDGRRSRFSGRQGRAGRFGRAARLQQLGVRALLLLRRLPHRDEAVDLACARAELERRLPHGLPRRRRRPVPEAPDPARPDRALRRRRGPHRRRRHERNLDHRRRRQGAPGGARVAARCAALRRRPRPSPPRRASPLRRLERHAEAHLAAAERAERTRVRLLRHVTCPYAKPALVLEDMARGRVVYTLNGQVHTLRLSDGHDTTVAEGTLARFTNTGVVIASGAKLRFIRDDTAAVATPPCRRPACQPRTRRTRPGRSAARAPPGRRRPRCETGGPGRAPACGRCARRARDRALRPCRRRRGRRSAPSHAAVSSGAKARGRVQLFHAHKCHAWRIPETLVEMSVAKI